jgi:PAS domain S-box-containing protein
LDIELFPDFLKTFSAAGFGICVVDSNLKVIWANDILFSWYGKDKLLIDSYYKTINNSGTPEICVPYRAFKEKKIISEEEYDPVNDRWFLATAYPTLNRQTSEFMAIVLLEEITERKSVLEKYLSQLDTLDNVEDAIYTTDFNNCVIFWNKGAEKIYGRSSSEVINKVINKDFQLYPEPDTEAVLQMTKELEVYRTYYYLREEYKADGSKMWVEGSISLLCDVTDKPLGLIYISRDITSRRNSEKINHLNARLQRDLREISSLLLGGAELETLEDEILSRAVNLTESSIGILVSTAEEAIRISSIYSHTPYSALTNSTYFFELIGKIYEWISLNNSSFISEYNDNKELSLSIKKILKAEEVIVSPCIVKKDIIALFLIAGPRYEFFKYTIEALNSFISIYSFVLNHFERKKFQESLEDKLRQTQKFETLSALLSGVVHDFNNILTGIGGAIGLVKQNTVDEKNIVYITNVETLLDRGSRLAKNLLNIGKPTAPQKSIFPPKKVIEEVCDFIRQVVSKKIKLEVAISDDLPDLEADYSQLHQVLVNIALNARDAVSNSGTITMTAKYREFNQNDYIQNANIKVGKFLNISISDTGAGITKENIKKIFDPYFTTKEKSKGTGLGLFVAYNIVNAHGGFFIVESELNKGTTFNIFLPYKHSARRAISELNRQSRGKSGTILLADDESTIRNLLAEMLKIQGYEVIEASSGQEAIKIIKAEKDKIKLVILDYYLEDMSGTEVLNEIEDLRKLFPIFIATGVAEEEIISELKTHRIDHIIEKPYEFETLLKLIDKVIA